MPIRPIVDGIGSPTHELARFLSDILTPLTRKTNTHIKSSHDFVQKVASVSIDPDKVMVSFDVSSLYTNVPKAEAIEVVRELLESDSTLGERTNLSVGQIIEGVETCLSLREFVFDSDFYVQDQGLAMGSPISPVLANAYMENFEQRALSSFQIPPKVFWRYVDDTFVIIKRECLNAFHQHLNSIDAHIQFSMELESTSGALPFLDCMVHKASGRLKTTVYHKPTSPVKVLSFSSAHPKCVFKSIALSVLIRVNDLCTNEFDRKAARLEVKNQLLTAGYPLNLIKRQLGRALRPITRTSREWVGTAVVPYKFGTSEALCRVLNSANIRVAFKKGRTLRSALVQLKDRLPVERTKDCVYKINCSECDKVYIGQTARELHVQINEHKKRINKPPRNPQEYQAIIRDSAIAGHALDTGHKIDLDNIEILRRGLRSTPQRLVGEALEIMKHNSVNKIEGPELPGAWRAVLNPAS